MKNRFRRHLFLVAIPVLALVLVSLVLGSNLSADEGGESPLGGSPLGIPATVPSDCSATVEGAPAWQPSAPVSPTVFLPFIAREEIPEEPPTECDLNAQELQIAQYMIEHPEQQRPSLTCHPILAQVARERAQDMADRGYFSHTNPDGYGPNYLVQQAGYILPAYYDQSPDGNNIESIAGGYPTAEAAWAGWMGSEGHRTHLLGLDPFWAEQIEYGIGYVYEPGSDYGHYWVVITAKQGP
jgi:uncharacterized protein YkwD